MQACISNIAVTLSAARQHILLARAYCKTTQVCATLVRPTRPEHGGLAPHKT
jgi:hypothetical protein